MNIRCAQCAKDLKVKDELAGKKIKCPGCGNIIAVPQLAVIPTPLSSPADERTLAPKTPLGDERAVPREQAEKESFADSNRPTASGVGRTGASKSDEDGGALTSFLAPPQADNELGRLGGFRILKVLGHGGMGVVFQGEDPRLGRKVAIKAMLPHLAQSKSAQERFIREAKAAAALEHDHIVPILQVGEDCGVPFIVMPFLQGEPLDERLKKKTPLALAEILRIGRETAEGLAAAHKLELIHRDIKPANLWLEGEKKRVKILDFGLARARGDQAHLTQTGAIIGTPAYMAPEQASGKPVDPRCDLFSLGCVLYRMCTGEMPFKGSDTISILSALALNNPPPPIELKANLPAELSDLVMQLLAKNPEERPRSAQAVAEALANIEGESAERKSAGARSTAVQERSGALRARSRAPGRKPLLLAVGGVLIAAVVAAIVIFWPTSAGTVRIEINDDDIEVTLNKTGAVIKGADKKHDITLAPGEHGLHVKRGDLEFDTATLILKKGEVVALKIEWFKEGKLQVLLGDRVIGAKQAAPPAGDYALLFEGKGTVDLPSVKLDSAGPYTIEAYITPKVLDSRVQHIVTAQAHASLFLNPTGPHVRASSGKYATTGSRSLVAGKKTHLAMVVTDKGIRLFIDGKPATNANTFYKKFNTGVNKSWLRLSYPSAPFNGIIGEVRFSKTARYDKEFTPAERLPPDADTIALYHCDEGSGAVLKDSSGNGHDGKIVGPTWIRSEKEKSPGKQQFGRGALRFGPGQGVTIPAFKEDHKGAVTLEGYATILEKSRDNGGWVTALGLGAFGGKLTPGSPFLRISAEGDWNIGVGTKSEKIKIPAQIKVPGQIGVRVHFACVRSDNEWRLFIDGKFAGAEKLSPKSKAKFGVVLGRGSFVGLIDGFRVSKVARYDKDFTPDKELQKDADTLLLYRFDEGNGPTLNDSSGNNYHGRIMGATWVKAGLSEPPK